MTLAGSPLAHDTVIDTISADGATVSLSPPPLVHEPLTLMVDLAHAQGTTRQGSPAVTLTSGLTDGAWQRALLVTGTNIPPGTTIADIQNDGRVLVLSQPARGTGPVDVTVHSPPEAGTMNAGSRDLHFATDVRTEGWKPGAPVRAMTAIAHRSKIEGVSSDGRTVQLSDTALADGTEDLTINLDYALTLTLPHSLAFKSPRFAAGVFSTAGGQSFDTLSVRSGGVETALGTVQWTGYVLDSGEFSLRGSVNSGITGQLVGQIWLQGNSKDYRGGIGVINTPNQDLITHFPIRLVSALNDDTATASYWDSLQSCDMVTAANSKQSAVDAIVLQNQFQTFFRRP